MTILVAGGTGFIGSHIIASLLAAPEGEARVRCMTRDPDRPSPWPQKVELVGGDVRDEARLDEATRGVEVVIHTVQFPNHPVEVPRRGYTYMQLDARGTRRMVKVAAANGVRRFIYLSGAGADRNSEKGWFRAKAIAEEAVAKSGMEYVILRPSWVYGPEDRSLNKFITMIKILPFVPVIGDGTARIQPVAVYDVATVAARAVRLEEATNRVFELGGPETLTMDEVLLTIQRLLGVKRLLLHHPVGFMKLATWPLQLLPTPPMSPQAVDFITGEALVDPQPTEETFGIRFMSLEEGLGKYLG
ncbi:MAG: complex I NDUFA9 subunit family protein [bacterium]|nr:complex I NDUFA9 subunit family protein [bacterium]